MIVISHCIHNGIDIPRLKDHQTASGARLIDYIPALNMVVRRKIKTGNWSFYTINPSVNRLPIVLCKIAGMAHERPCREMKKATELLHCNLPVKTLNNLIIIFVWTYWGSDYVAGCAWTFQALVPFDVHGCSLVAQVFIGEFVVFIIGLRRVACYYVSPDKVFRRHMIVRVIVYGNSNDNNNTNNDNNWIIVMINNNTNYDEDNNNINTQHTLFPNRFIKNILRGYNLWL